jgi:hypothetical protein
MPGEDDEEFGGAQSVQLTRRQWRWIDERRRPHGGSRAGEIRRVISEAMEAEQQQQTEALTA